MQYGNANKVSVINRDGVTTCGMSILKNRKTHRKAPVKKTFLAKFIGFKFATLLKAEFVAGVFLQIL